MHNSRDAAHASSANCSARTGKLVVLVLVQVVLVVFVVLVLLVALVVLMALVLVALVVLVVSEDRANLATTVGPHSRPEGALNSRPEVRKFGDVLAAKAISFFP